jgi:hypothetical protein
MGTQPGPLPLPIKLPTEVPCVMREATALPRIATAPSHSVPQALISLWLLYHLVELGTSS